MTDLLRQFEAFVLAEGGKIIDPADAGDRTFICASLPITSPVQPGDDVFGGMAVRVEGASLQLHAYMLRQICTNGMVAPVHQQAETFSSGQTYEFQNYLSSFLETLRQAEFPKQVQRFQLSLFTQVDELQIRRIAYQIAAITGNPGITRPFFLRVREEWHRPQANPRLTRGQHPRRFDVINGITALARDTADPAIRWELMRLGGDMLAGIDAPAPTHDFQRRELEGMYKA